MWHIHHKGHKWAEAQAVEGHKGKEKGANCEEAWGDGDEGKEGMG